MWTTAVFLTTLASPTAQAQELVIRWGEHDSVQYHLQSQISTPRGFRVYGAVNIDARLVALTSSMDTTCTSSPLGRGWALDCVIDEVSLQGAGFDGEEDKLAAILQEYEVALSKATIQIQVRSDGHFKAVDLEGPTKENKRKSYMHEQMRQIVRRTVSPLSIGTPKGGTDPGKKWKHRGIRTHRHDSRSAHLMKISL